MKTVKQKSTRNTKQRKKILEVLRHTDEHPTAAWIYDRLKIEFPSLSLGTVYRNLGILEEDGKIKKLRSGSTFDRFDAVVEPHAHFSCTRCGAIYDMKDIKIPDMLKDAGDHSSHRIDEVNVNYIGVCDKCLKKSMKED